MAHPLRDPRANGAKRRATKGQPFDPEDLSRRLTALLADQKSKAEQRRHARADKLAAEHQDIVYRHTPTVAATAFERTTTADVHRQAHKLGQRAMKQVQEVGRPDRPNTQQISLQRTQAMDQAIIDRNVLGNRNQFQWNHDMEEAVEVDVNRGVYEPLRRTFTTQFAHLRSRGEKEVKRPPSTGDIWDENYAPVSIKSNPMAKPDFEGRNDWAQQDEPNNEGSNVVKEKSMFLRKTESIWILRSKRETSSAQDKNGADLGDLGSPTNRGKGGKISFFTRFKRQPS
jgi:hypothetical protein